MTTVALTEVVFDQAIYPRAELSQATVNRYAESLNAGDEFPPIVLEPDTNRLLDGMHRWQAHKQALKDQIRVVWQEIPEGVPAKLYAASLSAKHGDRLSGDELKTIAREIAEANPEYDQKTIAKYCGMTQSTVSKWVSDITERQRNVRKVRVLLLRELGWSTRQIADGLKIPQQTVTRYINENILGRLTEDLIQEAVDGRPWVGSSMDFQHALEKLREERIFASWSDDERDLLKRIRNGETIVVSLRGQHNNLIDWADTAGLYMRIDRRTDWGNPFEMGPDGDRDTVIRNYEAHYLPHKPSLLSKLDTLRGKALGCWCAPDPCHGDVLKARAQ